MFRRAVQCKRNITSRVIHNSNRTPKKSRYSNGSIYLKSSPFQSFCLILLPLRGAPCNHKRMIVPLGLVILGGRGQTTICFWLSFLLLAHYYSQVRKKYQWGHIHRSKGKGTSEVCTTTKRKESHWL